MTCIHMDTEVVRETARLLDWTCGELYYMPPKLKNLASAISGVWQGGKSGHYASELRRMGEILQQEVINLQRLAVRVRNEVNKWENADNNGADAWLRIQVTPGTLGCPGEEQETPKEKFSWWDWSGAVGGGILTVGTGVVGEMQKLKYVDYQGMGRYLNKLAGNQKAGWVGKMDDLGHLVKKNSFFTSPVFKYSADAFSVAFDVADDLKSGDSWFKAIGSEALELGITKGVTKGLTYLIPGTGQVMLAYEGVLLAGRLVAGTADILGYDEQAAQLQNAIDVVDLSTYTEKLTDGIFDIVENRRR